MDIKLKTRKEMERDIPRNELGWWYDVCPNRVIRNVRQATIDDMSGIVFNTDYLDNLKTINKLPDPNGYFIEDMEGGSLINKKAVKYIIQHDF
jgi:hypothetical protein